MDMLAFTLLSSEGDVPAAEGSVKKARLASVQQWIEAHIGETGTCRWRRSPARTACRCAISISCSSRARCRRPNGFWNRRLQLAYDRLAKGDARSVTSVAFDHGFNSSAHFSTMFRKKNTGSPRATSGGPALTRGRPAAD
jgi:hypothetical protein